MDINVFEVVFYLKYFEVGPQLQFLLFAFLKFSV